MIKFGTSDSLVIPLVLPGAALTIGTSSLMFAFPPEWWKDVLSAIAGWFQSVGSTTPNYGPAIAAFIAAGVLAFYLSSVFFGVLVAILASRVELLILDAIQVRRSSYDSYWDQWYRYVESLEEQSTENAYITGLADVFLFCLRCSVVFLGLACLSLFLAKTHNWTASCLFSAAGVSVASIAFLWLAYKYHSELASIRKRRFSNPPRVLADASELLAGVLSRWCKREALSPLSQVLRVWPLKDSKSDLATASSAIDSALGMSNATVHASERDTLKSVKKLLDDAATKAQ